MTKNQGYLMQTVSLAFIIAGSVRIPGHVMKEIDEECVTLNQARESVRAKPSVVGPTSFVGKVKRTFGDLGDLCRRKMDKKTPEETSNTSLLYNEAPIPILDLSSVLALYKGIDRAVSHLVSNADSLPVSVAVVPG